MTTTGSSSRLMSPPRTLASTVHSSGLWAFILGQSLNRRIMFFQRQRG
jgi:hypothetical protein